MPSRKPTSQAACPICGKPEAERYRPFCSERCMEVDLGRWLKGAYRLPTDEQPGEQPGEVIDGQTGGGPFGQE